MIIYKPTGKQFKNRKEARLALGSSFYNKLEKEKRDLIFTNDNPSATNGNTICKNTEKVFRA